MSAFNSNSLPAGGGASHSAVTMQAVAGSELSLSAGQSLNAKVLDDLGDGNYSLQIDSDRQNGGNSSGQKVIVVQSKIPLPVDGELNLQAVEQDGKIALALTGLKPGGGAATGAAEAGRILPGDSASIPAPFLVETGTAELSGAMRNVSSSEIKFTISANDSGLVLRATGGEEISAQARVSSESRPVAVNPEVVPARVSLPQGSGSMVVELPGGTAQVSVVLPQAELYGEYPVPAGCSQVTVALPEGEGRLMVVLPQGAFPVVSTSSGEAIRIPDGAVPVATGGEGGGQIVAVFPDVEAAVYVLPESSGGQTAAADGAAQAVATAGEVPLTAGVAGESAELVLTVPQAENRAAAVIENAVPRQIPLEALSSLQDVQFSAKRFILQAMAYIEGEAPSLVQLRIPPASASELLAAIPAGAGGLLEATVISSANSQGFVTVETGGVRATLQLPVNIQLSQGDAITFQTSPRVMISGDIQVATESMKSADGIIDASIIASGLSPSESTRTAAAALLAQGLPISRESVASLVALAAGQSGAERVATLSAGAHLIANDIPVSPALASGINGMVYGQPVGEAIAATASAVSQTAANLAQPQTGELGAVLQALESMSVELGTDGTIDGLAKYFATFGREEMASALNGIENTVSQLLSADPRLNRIDALLSQLLPQLGISTGGTTVTGGAASLPGLGGSFATASGQAVPQESLLNDAARIAGDLLNADSSERAAELVKRLVESGNRSLLQSVASELEAIEQEHLSRNENITRLSDAAGTLRDIGRRFIAYKAENLAGLRNDPAVFVGEAPFRLDDEENSGRLQVFYRRDRRKRGQRWDMRVLLDLNTSNLGPVAGELCFYRNNLQVKLVAEEADTCAFLESGGAELAKALAGVGFTASQSFVVRQQAQEVVAVREAVSRPSTSSLDIEA